MSKIQVNTNKVRFPVAPDLYGLFFEDINRSADGGLYPEMLRNRSFEDSILPLGCHVDENNPDLLVTPTDYRSAFCGGEGRRNWNGDTIDRLKSSAKEGLIDLVTENGDKPSVYYLCPLYYQTRLYGITALSYIYPQNFKYQIRSWNEIISNSIELLRLKNDIHYLTLCQKTSSLYDSLTGFCKFSEFKRCLSESRSKANGLIAVKLCRSSESDLDLQGEIHSDMISSAAMVIKQVCTSRDVLCRTDDDILLILCHENRESIAERLQVLLHRDVYAKYFNTSPEIMLEEDEKASAKAVENILSRLAEAEKANKEAHLMSRQLPKYESLFRLRGDIIAQPQAAPDIQDASKRLCISEGYFRSIYKKCFGVSYVQDCINEKITLAKYLLCTTVMSVYTIAIQCGYKNEKYFAWQFHQCAGCSPARYRKIHCGSITTTA